MKSKVSVLIIGIFSFVLPQVVRAQVVTQEGAWCWFADPRAMHYSNDSLGISNSYIGYIDVHGNIKATQMNFNTMKREEVLVRSNYQPDDHDNPTFIALPDGRIMIFYSRHTDENYFYYRISLKAGDITRLGVEHRIKVANNTTYPSPFILSDDPQHIYLCWRGISWHPTIGRLPIPQGDDALDWDWGPYQMVQSTGARPYAKYASNGKDKIYVSYTTGHPDNEYPNWLYYNVIDINKQADGTYSPHLEDLKGNVLSVISKGVFNINKTSTYQSTYATTIIDAPSTYRDWVWQTSIDGDGHPVVAFTRISNDKTSHRYLYARWNGTSWKITDLCDAGGWFHQSQTEKCYSGGMSIDPDTLENVYLSIPTKNSVTGKAVYEIWKYVLNASGKVTSKEQITTDSEFGNVRPFILPGSKDTPLRLCWMYGNYYYWLVSEKYPTGFPTAIHTSYKFLENDTTAIAPLAESTWNKSVVASERDTISVGTAQGSPRFSLMLACGISSSAYHGTLFTIGDLSYGLDQSTVKPYIKVGSTIHSSQCKLGTSDTTTSAKNSTDGGWTLVKLSTVNILLTYDGETLTVYRNGLVDQRIDIAGLTLDDVIIGGFTGTLSSASVFDSAIDYSDLCTIMAKDGLDAITLPAETWSDLVFPSKDSGNQTITWKSSNTAVLRDNGTIIPPNEPTDVNVTATILGCMKEFTLKVHPKDLERNQILSYTFDTKDVFSIGDSLLVKDHSMYGRHALLHGNAGIDGTLNLTSNTAGGFSTNGYATVPSGLLQGLRSYTVLFTIKASNLDFQPRFYDFGSGSSNSIFLRASSLAAGLKNNGATTVLVQGGTTLNTNQEYKIAVTFDANAKTTKIYIDGAEDVSSTLISDEPYMLYTNALDIRNYIGRTQWWSVASAAASNVDFCGTIDDFQMYNTALSRSEICRLQDIDITAQGLVNGDFESAYSACPNPGVNSDRAIYNPSAWSIEYDNLGAYDLSCIGTGDYFYTNFFTDIARPAGNGKQTYYIRMHATGVSGGRSLKGKQTVALKAGRYTLTADATAYISNSNGSANNRLQIFAADSVLTIPSTLTLADAKNAWKSYSVDFELTDQSDVEVGFLTLRDNTTCELRCAVDNFVITQNEETDIVPTGKQGTSNTLRGIYSLSGQRIRHISHNAGIYIINGKKILVR